MARHRKAGHPGRSELQTTPAPTPAGQAAEPASGRINARQLDGPSLREYARARGLDPNLFAEERLAPPVSAPNLAVAALAASAEAAQLARREAHYAALPAFDARTATVAEVGSRLEALGLSDPWLLRGLREPPPAQPEQRPAVDPQALAHERDAAARISLARKAAEALATGGRIDVRRLSPDEFSAYLRGAGLDPTSMASVPARRIR